MDRPDEADVADSSGDVEYEPLAEAPKVVRVSRIASGSGTRCLMIGVSESMLRAHS